MLYKTTVIIWSRHDPSDVTLETLVYNAEHRDAIATIRDIQMIPTPVNDKDMNARERVFFGLKKTEPRGY